MKTAFFDLSGTILHHGTGRPLPLMKEILTALQQHQWKIVIVSRWSPAESAQLLRTAGIEPPEVILSSGNKGKAIAAYLATQPSEQSFFVDDKPANLESVKIICGDQVRVIGFIGSRAYVPALSAWCVRNRVELALSAIDLCEGLPVSLDSCGALFHSEKQWTEEDIARLLAGSDHPFSATAGETALVDHRSVRAELFGNRQLDNFEAVWRNIAWITCNECLWMALVESVLQSVSLDPRQVLGKTDGHEGYTQVLKDFAVKNPQIKLSAAFEQALWVLQLGIAEVGVEAEQCRIANRPMEHDRIQKVKQRLTAIFKAG